MIAATNRDLRAEVAAGRFRSDLYYRLNIVEVKLPPLRDRREDIPYLTAAFVRDTSERLQKPLLGLTPGAERLLTAASWEGNVRELRNVIERACILTDGEFITERELASSMPPPSPAPPAVADDAGRAHTLRTVRAGRHGPSRYRRARTHPARARAGRRQQEGRREDAAASAAARSTAGSSGSTSRRRSRAAVIRRCSKRRSALLCVRYGRKRQGRTHVPHLAHPARIARQIRSSRPHAVPFPVPASHADRCRLQSACTSHVV